MLRSKNKLCWLCVGNGPSFLGGLLPCSDLSVVFSIQSDTDSVWNKWSLPAFCGILQNLFVPHSLKMKGNGEEFWGLFLSLACCCEIRWQRFCCSLVTHEWLCLGHILREHMLLVLLMLNYLFFVLVSCSTYLSQILVCESMAEAPLFENSAKSPNK